MMGADFSDTVVDMKTKFDMCFQDMNTLMELENRNCVTICNRVMALACVS